MSFQVDSTYQFIINELNQGHRGLITLTPADAKLLSEYPTQSEDELAKILCILAHTIKPEIKFESFILGTLQQPDLKPQIILFALEAFVNHLVKGYKKEGTPIPVKVLLSLQPLLFHSSKEVVEWTLRTIEECGQQGVIFKKDLQKIKPSIWKLFSLTQRNILELITFLERRWVAK